MELRGTIQSLKSFEDVLVSALPSKLVHDGGKGLKPFGEDGKGRSYSKVYQLFPKGAKTIWEERINVRFHFDERYGVGTMKISAQGMSMMPKELRQLVNAVEDVYLIPKRSLTEEQAMELGALNLSEQVVHA